MKIFLLCLFSLSVFAQISITSSSRIILTNNNAEEQQAAKLLQSFIQKISYATLTIEPKYVSPKDGDIVLNNSIPSKNSNITEDGFQILCENQQLQINSTSKKGVIYGVVTILEKYLGVEYFGEHEYTYTVQPNISLPKISITENPAFRYRQSQSYAMAKDSLYKLWYRLEEPSEVFAATYWVHTFDRLLPSKTYGKKHPEYYAYFNGKRNPGKASQWCLTNEDVFKIVSTRIDSIFKANPTKNIISVSQNDGNFTNCTCEKCKAIDDREGALSGSLVVFLNKLAKKFPDKEFSTLAYLYSMHPPKYTKPLPNVNIMLCDIDCNREVSLTENESGRDFMKALEGWSKITNNIFVWDYGINFDNYVSPFPNFHILQDNIKLFKKNNATMHFSQIASSRGGDFAELRTYMVSKLMWNPEADANELMQHFLKGYYGKAAPYLCQYINMIQGALIGSGQRLWIYDSPVSHKKGMLKPQLMWRYMQLFDQAEKAVAQDTSLLKRVQRARLPLQFAELEIARTETTKDFQDISTKLKLFEKRVIEFDIPTLNERNNSPVEYCKLYRQRYMPRKEVSTALNKPITYITPPSKNYIKLAETALTDGLFGGSSFVESWVGWEGQDPSFVLDLGENATFSSVEVDFLHQLGAWVLLPLKVVYSYSTDGKEYTEWETHNFAEDRSVEVKFLGVKSTSPKPINARYIKVEVTATKVCPEWHYGVGHPSWVFVDEITISR